MLRRGLPRIGRAEPQNKEGESWTIITGRLSESIRQSCAMPLRSRRRVVTGTPASGAQDDCLAGLRGFELAEGDSGVRFE
jgi:hypothetical protein